MRRGASSVLGLAFVLSCASATVDVEVFRDRGTGTSGEECQIRYFRSADRLGETCELIGTLELRDETFSSDCGTDRVRREVSRVACELGGESAVVTRKFYDRKTCIQAHVDIFDCEPEFPAAANDFSAPE